MIKNIAGQKARFLAINTSTNTKVTGDAANITAYISKDGGALTQLTDTSATEIDATNAPGEYWFDVSQTESNADTHTFSAKSSSANVVLIYLGSEYSVPVYSSTLAIDSNGRVDVSKISGTSQTARDIGNSVLISSGTGTGQLDVTSGVVKANLVQILGTLLTETAGAIATAFRKFFNVSSPTGTVNSLPDAIAGATGGVAIVGSNMGTVASISSYGTLPDDIVTSIADMTIDGALDLKATLALVVSILGGKATVTGNTVAFKRVDGITTSITVVGDSSGNRTSITIGTLP